MPLQAPYRCAAYTLTTGSGAYVLEGTVPFNYQSLNTETATSDTVEAVVVGVGGVVGWEVVLLTKVGGSTFARTTIRDSSNGGAAVSWLAGRKMIFVVKPLTGLGTVQVYPTGLSTWNRPIGCRGIFVEMVGAGGGGGFANSNVAESVASGGGGGGGWLRKWFDTPPASAVVSIGVGGVGGTVGTPTGSNGASTTFGATLTAGGGIGGGAGTSGTSIAILVLGGIGGTCTGGDINGSGARGGFAMRFAPLVSISGAGGNSVLGSGGFSTNSGLGQPGTGFGAGGSGAAGANGNDFNGGTGSGGHCTVWEYY